MKNIKIKIFLLFLFVIFCFGSLSAVNAEVTKRSLTILAVDEDTLEPIEYGTYDFMIWNNSESEFLNNGEVFSTVNGTVTIDNIVPGEYTVYELKTNSGNNQVHTEVLLPDNPDDYGKVGGCIVNMLAENVTIMVNHYIMKLPPIQAIFEVSAVGTKFNELQIKDINTVINGQHIDEKQYIPKFGPSYIDGVRIDFVAAEDIKKNKYEYAYLEGETACIIITSGEKPINTPPLYAGKYYVYINGSSDYADVIEFSSLGTFTYTYTMPSISPLSSFPIDYDNKNMSGKEVSLALYTVNGMENTDKNLVIPSNSLLEIVTGTVGEDGKAVLYTSNRYPDASYYIKKIGYEYPYNIIDDTIYSFNPMYGNTPVTGLNFDKGLITVVMYESQNNENDERIISMLNGVSKQEAIEIIRNNNIDNSKFANRKYTVYKDPTCNEPLQYFNSQNNAFENVIVVVDSYGVGQSSVEVPYGTYYLKQINAPVAESNNVIPTSVDNDSFDTNTLIIVETKTTDLKGDLDRNNVVDANDASIALEIYKAENATQDDIQIGDMDNNGLIDANDASLILEYFKIHQ